METKLFLESQISLNTSADCLLASFKCSIEYYSEYDFELAIREEETGRNRRTVIRLLKRALKMKKLKANRI